MERALADELLEPAAEQRETVHLGTGEDVADRLAWREVTAGHADRLMLSAFAPRSEGNAPGRGTVAGLAHWCRLRFPSRARADDPAALDEGDPL